MVGEEAGDVAGAFVARPVARRAPRRAVDGVGIEDLEEVAKARPLRLGPERAVGLEHRPVERGIVVEGEGEEAEIGAAPSRRAAAIGMAAVDPAALGLGDRGRREGEGRLARVVAAARGEPDVGGVVHPHRRRDET